LISLSKNCRWDPTQ